MILILLLLVIFWWYGNIAEEEKRKRREKKKNIYGNTEERGVSRWLQPPLQYSHCTPSTIFFQAHVFWRTHFLHTLPPLFSHTFFWRTYFLHTMPLCFHTRFFGTDIFCTPWNTCLHKHLFLALILHTLQLFLRIHRFGTDIFTHVMYSFFAHNFSCGKQAHVCTYIQSFITPPFWNDLFYVYIFLSPSFWQIHLFLQTHPFFAHTPFLHRHWRGQILLCGFCP